ncbi:protein HEG homolog 1 [Protopterus annectens]|uniref:protein HEG homolog 1 n=1 Tax=Protopterus annectens TaxID=7888 RepID=UPI001CF9D349|nr:protein HEG homolog 1 [Protopterus annectens]
MSTCTLICQVCLVAVLVLRAFKPCSAGSYSSTVTVAYTSSAVFPSEFVRRVEGEPSREAVTLSAGLRTPIHVAVSSKPDTSDAFTGVQESASPSRTRSESIPPAKDRTATGITDHQQITTNAGSWTSELLNNSIHRTTTLTKTQEKTSEILTFNHTSVSVTGLSVFVSSSSDTTLSSDLEHAINDTTRKEVRHVPSTESFANSSDLTAHSVTLSSDNDPQVGFSGSTNILFKRSVSTPNATMTDRQSADFNNSLSSVSISVPLSFSSSTAPSASFSVSSFIAPSSLPSPSSEPLSSPSPMLPLSSSSSSSSVSSDISGLPPQTLSAPSPFPSVASVIPSVSSPVPSAVPSSQALPSLKSSTPSLLTSTHLSSSSSPTSASSVHISSSSSSLTSHLPEPASHLPSLNSTPQHLPQSSFLPPVPSSSHFSLTSTISTSSSPLPLTTSSHSLHSDFISPPPPPSSSSSPLSHTASFLPPSVSSTLLPQTSSLIPSPSSSPSSSINLSNRSSLLTASSSSLSLSSTQSFDNSTNSSEPNILFFTSTIEETTMSSMEDSHATVSSSNSDPTILTEKESNINNSLATTVTTQAVSGGLYPGIPTELPSTSVTSILMVSTLQTDNVLTTIHLDVTDATSPDQQTTFPERISQITSTLLPTKTTQSSALMTNETATSTAEMTSTESMTTGGKDLPATTEHISSTPTYELKTSGATSSYFVEPTSSTVKGTMPTLQPTEPTFVSGHITSVSLTSVTLGSTTSTATKSASKMPAATTAIPMSSTVRTEMICIPNPCFNQGTCVVNHTSSRTQCKCPDGWKGENCTEDVDECQTKEPCVFPKICHNIQGSFTCRCPVGYELDKRGDCALARTFGGEFYTNANTAHFMNATHFDDYEIHKEMVQVLNASLSSLNGYIESVVTNHSHGSPGSILVRNMFTFLSNMTSPDVFHAVEKYLKSCAEIERSCKFVRKFHLSYRAESLCHLKLPKCDRESSNCSDFDGIAVCQCKLGYFKYSMIDHSCKACADGTKWENGSCVRCPFGFGGFNCENPYKFITVVIAAVGGLLLMILGTALAITCCRKKKDLSKLIFKSGDFQMSPYSDFPKNPRISVEWGRETIEMQENGSTKNLLQMTDVYYSPGLRNPDAERNGVYAYTGLPGSRHSCIYPGQYNPSFISDDSRRRDYF